MGKFRFNPQTTREPQPIELAPVDQEIMIFAPELSKSWIKATLTWPKKCRSVSRRWLVCGIQGAGFSLSKAYIMHSMFQPQAWMPMEDEPCS